MTFERPWLKTAIFFLLLTAGFIGLHSQTSSKEVTAHSFPTPRVNIPYTPELDEVPVVERAIFWFGEVGPTTQNYVDVRSIYNDEKLVVTAHVFDRALWFDTQPDDPSELTEWDAASLYISLNESDTLGAEQHLFVSQFSSVQRPREDYQAAYRGSAGEWEPAGSPFETMVGWQGEGYNNNAQSWGWNLTFFIPFSSLDLSSPPPEGTIWRMALSIHDRDSEEPSAIPITEWPENKDNADPTSWGLLGFGLPEFAPPPSIPGSTVSIRDDGSADIVEDVHVGGRMTCASHIWPNFWAEWGDLNYSGDQGFNVQNQWNLGDWPCFSKYYITFPLDSIPPGKTIVSATLTLYMFSNSNSDGSFEGDPQPSLIQALSVSESWQEESLTWNNAPPGIENIAATWVTPRPENAPPNAHFEYHWAVSRAVVEAYTNGNPLRLVLYSADNSQHSGKYFRASEYHDPDIRPTLTIEWGTPIQQLMPYQTFLPLQYQ